MKLTGSFSRMVFCSAVASGVALFSTVWAAPGSATITKIVGQAEVSTNGTTWTAAANAKMLSAGASIRTPAAAQSQVDVDLGANGGPVQLVASTELRFEKLNLSSSGAGTVADTGLDLKAGTIVGTIKSQLPTGSTYEVKTPSSVIRINVTRGPTRYQISANGTAIVLDGQLVVARTGQATATVNAGQTFNATGAAAGTVTTGTTGAITLPPPLTVAPPPPPSAPTAPTVGFVSPLPEVSGVTAP